MGTVVSVLADRPEEAEELLRALVKNLGLQPMAGGQASEILGRGRWMCRAQVTDEQ
jgi:hypothetical protein